jgi:phosphatidylinositol phospholipase C, delta
LHIMAPEPDQPKLPLRAAGGGGPTEAAQKMRVDGFREQGHVAAYLDTIYASDIEGKSVQERLTFNTKDSFTDHMRSKEATALGPVPKVDLSQPLSQYYISSSHNTYLTGHQLYGDATTAGYTNVLKRGCRCLEIDIWDGDDSDTSASSSDEDEQPRPGEQRSKTSKWSKMKAKAARIRGSSPGKSPEKAHAAPGPNEEAGAASQKPSADTAAPPPEVFRPEPQVVHGWTLTQAIPFRQVCAAIRESAFTATDLPLIVSLETHTNHEQQQIMVDIMKEAWGEFLVDPKEAAKVGFDTLPSPDSLRRKILIKVKWSPGLKAEDESDLLKVVDTNTTNSSAGDASKPSKMLPQLSELGMFTRAFSFKQWDQPESAIATHVYSLTESKAHEMFEDPHDGPKMFEHNRNYLTRIYPRGTRIRSSNYDPLFHWTLGSQIVALNWQSLDHGMMLNEGMFAGYQGFVLKPDGFRGTLRASSRDSAPLKSSAATEASILRRKLKELKVTVFAAENIPTPSERDSSHPDKLKPYLKFELHVDTHGSPGAGKKGHESRTEQKIDDEEKKERKKYKRRSKTQKTDSPDFDKEDFSWTDLSVVETLSFLRYVVHNFLNDLFWHLYSIPLLQGNGGDLKLCPDCHLFPPAHA